MEKVHFWPSNFCLDLILAIELQNRVSLVIQLLKPFIFDHRAVLLPGFADVDATWRWGPLVSHISPLLSLFSCSSSSRVPGSNAAAPPHPVPEMGNSLGGKRKGAKVMQLDGTSFRVKPPAAAADVLRDHPGFQLLESEEVKLQGARARLLPPDAPLRRGRLYFLVALPRRAPAAAGAMRRAWSGNLCVGARERLESLMLARRSTSDLSSLPAHASASAHASARVTSERSPGILRSPQFAKTPEWGAGFMLPPPPAKTPQRKNRAELEPLVKLAR